jgi:putative transposase
MQEEAYRANAPFDARRDDPEFGYRLLADEARVAGGRDGAPDRMADLPGQPRVERFGKKGGRGKKGRPTGARRPGTP